MQSPINLTLKSPAKLFFRRIQSQTKKK